MSQGPGEKTEKPTPKKLKEARKEGQIPKSVDLVQWLVLLMVTFVLPALTARVGRSVQDQTRELLTAATTGRPEPVMDRLDQVLMSLLGGVAPLFAMAVITAVVGLAIQGGVVLTAKPLKPKAERISPKAGMKRLFSSQALVDTAKSVIRLVILAVVAATIVRAIIAEHMSPVPFALDVAAVRVGEQIVGLVRVVAFAGLLVGLGDYLYQRYKTNKKLKMSKHEIKQEMRQSDGDPMIKGRRRQTHAKLSRNRMLAAVDDASAVVVNPTHVAVAIKYAEGTGAPRVVAKGGDELAMRIRERAQAAGVPIVEARPLARILHDRVEVGHTIPEELFRAIAIVLAFVMRHPPKPNVAQRIPRVTIPPSALRLTPPAPTPP